MYVAALFPDILDLTIVNVAIPTLGRDFVTENAEWIVLGYTLSLAVWIPVVPALEVDPATFWPEADAHAVVLVGDRRDAAMRRSVARRPTRRHSTRRHSTRRRS